jgi:hypothetical protein
MAHPFSRRWRDNQAAVLHLDHGIMVATLLAAPLLLRLFGARNVALIR